LTKILQDLTVKKFYKQLFTAKAINGSENTSRIWAIIGMAFHSVGYGVFLSIRQKDSCKKPAIILKYIGAANIVFTFLIATSLHDIGNNIEHSDFDWLFYILYLS